MLEFFTTSNLNFNKRLRNHSDFYGSIFQVDFKNNTGFSLFYLNSDAPIEIGLPGGGSDSLSKILRLFEP